MSSPFGALTATDILATDGDTLSGSFDLGDGRIWPIEDGVTDGNEISFRLDRDGSPIVYDMSGTVEERFVKLELLINMVSDAEWELEDKERKTILSALAYFCDPEDLIPDHIPAIGFLDDAIYVEIIIQELSAEISSYEEFFTYRVAEENRRKNKGLDTTVGREDWLADKRSVLHSRMRARRSGGSGGSGGTGWRTRLF